MSILLIDSALGSKASLQGVFYEQGFKSLHIVESASLAREFLNDYKQNYKECLNLIIISNTVSDADSFELCREMRTTEIGKTAYILLLVSSVENKSAIVKAKQCGADNFATKPYAETAFLKQLEGFTRQRVFMLVEDDPVVRQLLATILCKQKIEVISVDDGMLAHNLINAMLPPRLVIMDIGLPRMNGLKLVAHIRSKIIWNKTPILMLTASTDINDVKKALASGANGYIAKPFEIPNFMQRIEKYIYNSETSV